MTAARDAPREATLDTENWLKDESIVTDAEGNAMLRAFHGDHRVTVEHDGTKGEASAELTADGATVKVTLQSQP